MSWDKNFNFRYLPSEHCM